MDFFLAASPILLVAVLILIFRRGVIFTGAVSLVFTGVLVFSFFQTPLRVVILSAADGVVTTLPLILVVYSGILLADILLDTGFLGEVGEILAGRGEKKGVSGLLVSFGLANALEGAGLVAEPLTAPLFRVSGFSPEDSALLSVWGYAGFLTLEFAGILMAVLSLATEVPVERLLNPTGVYSALAGAILAAGLPFVVRSYRYGKKDIIPLGLSAAAGGAGVFFSLRFLSYKFTGPLIGLFAGLLLFPFLRNRTRKEKRLSFPAGTRALLFVLAAFLAVNLIPGTKEFLRTHLSFPVRVIPTRPITFSPATDVYTYLFLAGYLSLPRERGRGKRYLSLLRDNLTRGGRAAVAMALFGALGQVISFSGYSSDFVIAEGGKNAAAILASGMLGKTGPLALLFVPLLGWSGTFLTGYGVASIMLFGKLTARAGSIIGADPALLVSVLAVGASVGSVSSPFKIAIATPLCDAQGKEPAILRRTIPGGIIASLILGVILLIQFLFS